MQSRVSICAMQFLSAPTITRAAIVVNCHPVEMSVVGPAASPLRVNSASDRLLSSILAVGCHWPFDLVSDHKSTEAGSNLLHVCS